jgi:2-oxoglutarate ferredoxin oxidoreductase subunit beta
MLIRLEHGQPIRFGAEKERGVVMDSQGHASIVDVAAVGEDKILMHDESREDPALAFALARLATSVHVPTPIGVFRDVQRPEYAEETQRQLAVAQERSGPGDLKKLLHSGATWVVD